MLLLFFLKNINSFLFIIFKSFSTYIFYMFSTKRLRTTRAAHPTLFLLHQVADNAHAKYLHSTTTFFILQLTK